MSIRLCLSDSNRGVGAKIASSPLSRISRATSLLRILGLRSSPLLASTYLTVMGGLPEESLLAETHAIHVDDRYHPVTRTMPMKMWPLSGERLGALITPTPVRQVGRLMLTYLRQTRHVG